MKIQNDCVVAIHYTLTNTNGDVLDSSQGRPPLRYLHGYGNIIPGLENALLGRQMGEALNVTVEPAEGYGEHNPDMVQEVPRAAFQGVDHIEVGMQFHAQAPDGNAMSVTVVAVSPETVTVDANHELAGERLFFAVSIEEVRTATPEEIDHGHVH